MGTTGAKIRELRLSKGLSLDDLAKISDTTKSYIWEMENRPDKRLDKNKISAIAAALGVTLASLLEDEVTVEEEVEEKRFFRKFKQLDERDKKIIDDIMKSLNQHK